MSGWERSEFYALAARLNAAGIDEARPPNEDETACAYLPKLYGWVMDACMPVIDLSANEVKVNPIYAGDPVAKITATEGAVRRYKLPVVGAARNVRFDDHLIDHDAEALLKGKDLDPDKRGVEFTYRRGSF